MVQMIQPNTDASITRFFFIRHGQTEHNIRKILQGHLDIPLNSEGHSQAEKLGAQLSSFPFDKIYSSDLTRCRETVGKVVDGLEDKKAVHFTNDLRERNMGEIEGMHIDDAIAHGEKMGKHYREFGEGAVAFEKRLSAFLKMLKQEAQEQKFNNVAVVSHGGTIRAVLKLLGKSDAGIVYNTSITVLDLDQESGEWTVKVVGDTEHLGQQMNVADQRVR